MGAGKDVTQYVEHFVGAARVVAVADRDEPGVPHATAWADALDPVVETVEIVVASRLTHQSRRTRIVIAVTEAPRGTRASITSHRRF